MAMFVLVYIKEQLQPIRIMCISKYPPPTLPPSISPFQALHCSCLHDLY